MPRGNDLLSQSIDFTGILSDIAIAYGRGLGDRPMI
jgi:hypothetical protein